MNQYDYIEKIQRIENSIWKIKNEINIESNRNFSGVFLW